MPTKFCVLMCLALVLLPHFLLAQKKKKTKYNYLTPCLSTAEIKALPNKIDKIYYMSIGHFTNKKQADTTRNPIYKEQEFICVPIWRKQRVGEYWAFFSWYQANNLETPLGQFVFKITKKDRDTFAMEMFGIPEEMRGIGWKDEDPFSKFKPQDLIKGGCVHYAYAIGEDAFQLKLPPGSEPCAASDANRMNTPYYAFETQLFLEQQVSYSTFYDKDKKILVAYKPLGNHFEKIPKDQPKYLDMLYPKEKKKKNKN